MRGGMKTLILLGVGALVISPVCVSAQTEDIAVFDNQTNDFLLPTYFDAPPAAPTQEQPFIAPPNAPMQPVVPQNVPSDIDILTEIFGDQAVPGSQNTPQATSSPMQMGHSQVFYPTPKSVTTATAQKQPLLTPLAPLPEIQESTPPPPRNVSFISTHASDVFAQESGANGPNVILPKDVRLQFLPGKTQLTQSVVKWISSYAMHIRKDPRLMLTIRISNKNWPVQQARLSLIMQVLFEHGLSTRQLQIFQSDRDPDTLIIGMDNNQNQTQIIVPGETTKHIKQQKTLSW